jgi:hypothetical protein
MATKHNKLIPVLGIVAVAIVGTIVWKNASGPSRPQAGAPMTEAPKAELPPTKGADRDTPQETLLTVVASNRELRNTVEQLIRDNQALRVELDKDRRARAASSADVITPTGSGAPNSGVAGAAAQSSPAASAPGTTGVDRGVVEVFSKAFDRASEAANQVTDKMPGAGRSWAGRGAAAVPAAAHGTTSRSRDDPDTGQAGAEPKRRWPSHPEGVVAYKVMPPMGYALQANQPSGRGGVVTGSYVRTTVPAAAAPGTGPSSAGPATRAADAAARAEPIPYFTIPENSTLAGVVSMTSLIGRVPIDGRVTDPMQWKAVVGRDNLAASGFEMPDDLTGMIVSGIAIGDMALSCTEGKVRSITFVFNDGTINTVSTRQGASGGVQMRNSAHTAPGSASGDLGYISDLHGNPCIAGKFVTNAPAYLTDIVGTKTLEVAGQAYADAQRTVTQSTGMLGSSTSSAITGSMGSYVLGQAVSGAADEVSKWLLSRLKNSFDAVVTASGQRLVVHLDAEVRIDKQPQGRRLVHRQQNALQHTRGAHHGLE